MFWRVGVDVKLSTAASAEVLRDFDDVVVATGIAHLPFIKGIEIQMYYLL